VQKQDATRPFLYTKEKMTTNVVAFHSRFHAWSFGLSFYPSINNSCQQHSLLVGSPGLAHALTPAAQNQMTHASTEGLGPAWTVATTATLSRVVFPGARRPGAWARGWVAAPCWPTRGRDTWNGFFGAFVRVIRCVCGGGIRFSNLNFFSRTGELYWKNTVVPDKRSVTKPESMLPYFCFGNYKALFGYP